MTPPPTSIDGTDITGATIDGQEVQEITIDGQTVFTAFEFIDNFEDGNIVEYGGSTNSFTTTTNNPIEGNTSLIFNDFGVGRRSMISTSGLDNIPVAGQAFSVKTRASQYANNQSYLCFGASADMVPLDAGDGYYILLEYNTSNLELNVQENGNNTVIDETGINYSDGETLTTEVDWGSNGSFSVTVSDSGGTLATLSGSDSRYSSGGFGFAGSTFGTNVPLYYDDARLI